ncbi:MAG: MFS transporter [Sandaracinaceae bacterium]|nr:MFS transporter [Sandaracinaceae bacterium]
MADGSDPPEKLTGYHWKLFGFLSVATFFEGYDHIALSQLLPNLREAFGVSESGGGYAVAIINVGTILAYFLVRKADRWGRKRVLTITIAGYTLFSFGSALAPNIWVFAILQLVARVFLIGEWAISMVYAAEEFPAARRGLMIGLIQGFSSLGSVVCAGVVPLLLNTPWGWRTVYFVGTVPLILLAFARRGLKESKRFDPAAVSKEAQPLTEIWRTPYAKRVLQLAAIWALTYVCAQTAVTFWKEYATAAAPAAGPHLTDAEVGGYIVAGAVIAMPLVFAVGPLIDWLGRKKSAVVIFGATAISAVGAYTTTNTTLLFVSVVGAIFGASAVLPVLNAFSTELFPTHLRGSAFAWSNNLLGRVGYVLAPAVVGAAAEVFGWGPSVAVTAIGPLAALVLILMWLPETSGKSLEATSHIAEKPTEF